MNLDTLPLNCELWGKLNYVTSFQQMTTQEVQWAAFWGPLSCLSHRKGQSSCREGVQEVIMCLLLMPAQTPQSSNTVLIQGTFLWETLFRIKLRCFFHCNYLFLGTLHFPCYFFITEFHFDSYFSVSWLLTFQLNKDVLVQKKKKKLL